MLNFIAIDLQLYEIFKIARVSFFGDTVYVAYWCVNVSDCRSLHSVICLVVFGTHVAAHSLRTNESSPLQLVLFDVTILIIVML